MVTIKLAKPWTFRTPLVTIEYEAGEHEVFQYIANAAQADGAIDAPEEKNDGGTSSPAKAGTKGNSGSGKG